MPLEIVINVKDRNAITKLSTLNQIEKLDNYLKSEPFISTPLSILNLIKGATQAFYNDNPADYRLPTNMEKSFILKYFASSKGQKDMLKSFIDSTGHKIRMTAKVKDLGTIGMDSLMDNKLMPKIKEIFGDKAGDVHITGTTLLYLKGTKYLINDLSSSLLIAFVLISLMMAFIFTDIKMIIISIIPNVVPMIMTAGLMGLLDIPLKTSTALIFSISFGISIDNTIHFLSKYKQELFNLNGNVRLAVVETIKDSSVSMIYTSLVLFCGFGIFMLSDFGGTVALGLLTSTTLFFALFTNMILLPALLLAWEKKQRIVLED
jgi:predicted RND superfamily exporter protein